MYSYLYFGITLLSIFSIIENLKSGQIISFFKVNIIFFLILVAFASVVDFLFEYGYDFIKIKSTIRFLGMCSFVNLFYMVAKHRVPKIILFLEAILFITFIILIFFGFQFVSIIDGNFTFELTLLHKINFITMGLLVVISMIYNLSIIFNNTNKTNLYQIRIKRWSFLLVLILISVITLLFFGILLYTKIFKSPLFDSRSFFVIFRLLFLLFILCRPKFMDESGYALKLNFLHPAMNSLSLSNFEFLFYGNQYFLHSEANLDDFSLKLNHSKAEVSNFIKNHMGDSFIELLNKNRINYFKELLKSKHHETFTIEALSQMSGFNNRQSMYNSFKKYEGCSPSDYINYL